jgi:hypothetical protein
LLLLHGRSVEAVQLCAIQWSQVRPPPAQQLRAFGVEIEQPRSVLDEPATDREPEPLRRVALIGGLSWSDLDRVDPAHDCEPAL